MLSLLAVLGVMASQQIGALTTAPAASATPEKPVEIKAPEAGDQFTMTAGVLVRVTNALKSIAPGGKLQPAEASMLATSIEDSAVSKEEHFRALIVVAELAGVENLGTRLDDAEKSMDYPGAKADVATLRMIVDGKVGELTPEQRTALTERHGYFGRLALSLGLPDTDPSRKAYVQGGGALMAFLVGLFAFIVVVIIASLACFVILMVMWGGGKIRRSFVPPAPGGSVYLEMVAVLAGSFLLLQGVGLVIASLVAKKGAAPPDWLMPASLALQWLLLPIIFWPLLRGVSFAEHRRRMGWTSGAGVFKEAGLGVFAYLASLPAYVVVIVITAMMMLAYQAVSKAMGHESPPVKNEIAEILGGGSPAVLIMLFLLATIWAPIVEEAVFRGALFRHMRGRWGVVLSALVSAMAFGAMHGYMFLMLPPVIALGFVFALMREWRGSLIASMTAHALHNGTLLIIVLTLLTLAKPE